MVKSVLHFKTKFRIVILTLIFLYDGSAVFPHSPHDVIDLVEISDTYELDKTLFMYERNRLFKSTNGGYSWKQLVKGLKKDFSASAIAISPVYSVDGTVFLSSRGGGIYKSVDRGLSWAKLNNNLSNERMQLLAISPGYLQNKILLVSNQQGIVYKSINAGENFYKVHVGAEVTALAFASEVETKLMGMGDAEGGLYISLDNGETWLRKAQISNSGAVTAMAISPRFISDKTIVVGTEEGGVLISTDGGTSFQNRTNELPDKYITSVVMSPEYEKDSTIFVSSWYAVFRSNDGGKTWIKSSRGLTSDPQADTVEFKSPHFRGLRLSKNFSKDRTLFVAGFDGLFKSDDGAQSWIELETLAASHIQHLALSPAYKDDSTMVITTFNGGFYISQNRGMNWETRNKGLLKTHLWDVEISPNFAKDHTIFTTDNSKIYKSVDEGQHWRSLEIERCSWGWGWRKCISSVLSRTGFPDEVLLTQADRLCKQYLFPWIIVISPGFKTDHTVFLGTRYQGLFRFVDGGLHGSFSSMTEKNGWISSLVLSPEFPAEKTIFAGKRKEGVFKSLDGGETWRMVYDSKEKEILVAISPYFKMDKTVFAGVGQGLVKTIDAGNSWEKIGGSCCDEKASIKVIAISPNYQNDKTIIVSVEGSGLFKSENGGVSFVEIGTELIKRNHNLKILEFSPAYEIDHTLVGASNEEIFLSVDAGKTWDWLKRPIRYEERTDYIRYEGKWVSIQNENYSAMKAMHSDVPTSKAKFNFVGSGIRWIGTKGNDNGIGNVYLDGKLKETVNLFSTEQQSIVPVFSVNNLPEGPHSITIEVTNTKHPKSSGHLIEIDAFDVVR